jgi:hypothetical protein
MVIVNTEADTERIWNIANAIWNLEWNNIFNGSACISPGVSHNGKDN